MESRLQWKEEKMTEGEESEWGEVPERELSAWVMAAVGSRSVLQALINSLMESWSWEEAIDVS